MSPLLALLALAAPPDIVVVVLDDLDKVVSEPFTDRIMARTTALGAEGVVLDRAFTQTSICCPSRATLLTGLCGHNTGVLTNGGPQGGWKTFHARGMEERTVAVALQAAGYRTAAVGKYMNGYEMDGKKTPPVPPGWTEWHVQVDAGAAPYRGYDYHLLSVRDGRQEVVAHGSRDEDYSTDVFRDLSVRFIDEHHARTPASPLFLYVAPTAPHVPLPAARRHAAVARQWADQMPVDRPNFFADGATIDDKPRFLRLSWGKRKWGPLKRYNARDWADRLGSLYAADELVGAIVDRLKALGRWDNTLLIVLSDNGYNLGAHGLVHKMAPYEESIRVPFLVAAGKDVGLRRGAREDRWVAHVDLVPTLRDAAGLAPVEELDGRSLLPMLRGQEVPSWRDALLLEYAGGGAANGFGIAQEFRLLQDVLMPPVLMDLPGYRGLRVQEDVDGKRRTLKYVEWETGERELYDLDADPWELDNRLFSDATAQAPLARRLHERLETLARCKGTACR